jgi:hypothetical protein
MEVDAAALGGDHLETVREDKDGWRFVAFGLGQTYHAGLLAFGAFQLLIPLFSCRAPWKTAPSAPRGIAPSLDS